MTEAAIGVVLSVLLIIIYEGASIYMYIKNLPPPPPPLSKLILLLLLAVGLGVSKKNVGLA